MIFYILGGLPGSGKTTTSRRLKAEENCFVVSSDTFRLGLNSGSYPRGEDFSKLEPIVWELVQTALIALLRLGENAGLDATNLSRSERARWVDLVRREAPRAEIVLLWHSGDHDSAERWATERGHTAEEYVAIRSRLIARVEEPSEDEGFRIVRIGQ